MHRYSRGEFLRVWRRPDRGKRWTQPADRADTGESAWRRRQRRSHRRRRARVHAGRGPAARRSLRREGWTHPRRGIGRRHSQPGDAAEHGVRRQRPDDHARLHRRPHATQRRQRAVRRQRQPAAASREIQRGAAQEGRRDAARPVGRRLQVRRHEADRRPARAARTSDAACAGSTRSRVNHRGGHTALVQQPGLRAGRHHPAHPGPGGRAFCRDATAS